MSDIFISYRREGGEKYAEKIWEYLKNNNYDVFFDKHSLKPGKKFPDLIRCNINNCSDFVMIVTPEYFGRNKDGVIRILNADDWVKEEILLALKLEKRILPIHFYDPSSIYSLDLPNELNDVPQIQGIKFQDFNDDFFKSLINSLSDESKKTVTYGKHLGKLKEISVVGKDKFTHNLKEYILNLNKEDIKKYIVPIIESKENTKIRFTAYYGAFTYYRRNKLNQELYKLVENYNEKFSYNDFPLSNIIMTQYHRFKYGEDESNFDNLDTAIIYSEKAIDKINNNDGVYVTYSELIVEGLKNKKNRYIKYIDRAIEYILKAKKKKDDYPKTYAIHAILLAYKSDFKRAKYNIDKAIELEDTEKKISYMRMIEYYIIKNQIEFMRESRKKTIILIGIFLFNDIFILILLFFTLFK